MRRSSKIYLKDVHGGFTEEKANALANAIGGKSPVINQGAVTLSPGDPASNCEELSYGVQVILTAHDPRTIVVIAGPCA